MKRLIVKISLVCAMAASSRLVVPQTLTKGNPQDQKHMLTTMPNGKGRLRLVADSIDKDWAASTVHLKGDVRAEIWTAPKNVREAMFLSADEVDYNESTGAISPRGNVRLTVDDIK